MVSLLAWGDTLGDSKDSLESGSDDDDDNKLDVSYLPGAPFTNMV